MVIQNENDPWANADRVREYVERLAVEKELLWLDLSKDRAAAYDWLGEHPGRVVTFFDQHV